MKVLLFVLITSSIDLYFFGLVSLEFQSLLVLQFTHQRFPLAHCWRELWKDTCGYRWCCREWRKNVYFFLGYKCFKASEIKTCSIVLLCFNKSHLQCHDKYLPSLHLSTFYFESFLEQHTSPCVSVFRGAELQKHVRLDLKSAVQAFMVAITQALCTYTQILAHKVLLGPDQTKTSGRDKCGLCQSA